MESRDLGLLLIGVAVILALVGIAVATGLLGWVGRLPGDIRLEGANARVYVPLASMLVVSVCLSLLLWVLRRVL